MWHRGRQNGGQVEQALHGRPGEAGPRGQGEAPGSMVKIMVIINNSGDCEDGHDWRCATDIFVAPDYRILQPIFKIF